MRLGSVVNGNDIAMSNSEERFDVEFSSLHYFWYFLPWFQVMLSCLKD